MGDVFVKHFRDMTADRTQGIFNKLAVHSQDDALSMLRAYLGMARKVFCSTTAARHSAASLVDLPCQSCELGGVLGAVAKARRPHRPEGRQNTRGHGGGRGLANTRERGAAPREQLEVDDIRWLLSRLPADLSEALRMMKGLKGLSAMAEGKGDGLDRQCSGTVAAGWLRSQPPVLANSWLTVLDRQADLPFELPVLRCRSCDGLVTVLHGRGGHFDLCRPCRTAAFRAKDAARQATKRALHA